MININQKQIAQISQLGLFKIRNKQFSTLGKRNNNLNNNTVDQISTQTDTAVKQQKQENQKQINQKNEQSIKIIEQINHIKTVQNEKVLPNLNTSQSKSFHNRNVSQPNLNPKYQQQLINKKGQVNTTTNSLQRLIQSNQKMQSLVNDQTHKFPPPTINQSFNNININSHNVSIHHLTQQSLSATNQQAQQHFQTNNNSGNLEKLIDILKSSNLQIKQQKNLKDVISSNSSVVACLQGLESACKEEISNIYDRSQFQLIDEMIQTFSAMSSIIIKMEGQVIVQQQENNRYKREFEGMQKQQNDLQRNYEQLLQQVKANQEKDILIQNKQGFDNINNKSSTKENIQQLINKNKQSQIDIDALSKMVMDQQNSIVKYKSKEKRIIVLLTHLQQQGNNLEKLSSDLFNDDGSIKNSKFNTIMNEDTINGDVDILTKIIKSDPDYNNHQKQFVNQQSNKQINKCELVLTTMQDHEESQICQADESIVNDSNESSFEFQGKIENSQIDQIGINYEDRVIDIPSSAAQREQNKNSLKIDLHSITKNRNKKQ